MKHPIINKYASLSIPFVAVGMMIVGTATYAHGGFGNLTAEEQAIAEEVRDLHEQGLHEEAFALAREAGIPPRHGHRHGGPPEEVREAIIANDYNAFLEAISGTPFSENANEETFAQMVEAHELRESGDFEGARAIMDEIGIFPKRGFGCPLHEESES